MALVRDVALMSGKRVSLEADPEASVGSLKQRAQRALEVGHGRIFNSFESILDGDATLEAAGLLTGECLTLHIGQLQISAGKDHRCFAAWGKVDSGGDSRAVQDKLRNAQRIQASHAAFSAILGDGSVVTWGDEKYGGDSRAVQDQLQDVQRIQASIRAFAAILGNESVITWGSKAHGGNSSAVKDRPKDVKGIQATGSAFAMGLWSHGAAISRVATVDACKASCRMCNRSNPAPELLLPYWPMGLSSHGVM